MTKTNDMRIYAASLSDYNAGVLHGEWIAVTDEDTMHEAIQAMLEASPTAKKYGDVAEEWAIHDYEGFGDYKLSEFTDLETIVNLKDGYEQHGAAFLAWAAHDPNNNTDPRDFEERFHGEYESLADYVQDYWEQCGGWKEEDNPNMWWHPSRYVDWDAMGRDLEMGGDVFTIESENGKVFVFDNH